MNSKYPQGYIPKIEYWQYKVNKAIAARDWAGAEYSMKKLSHFVSRQYVVENEVPHALNVNREVMDAFLSQAELGWIK